MGINYLRMRGATNNDFFGTSPIEPIEKTYTWSGVGEALTMALKMEKEVTGRMKDMKDILLDSSTHSTTSNVVMTSWPNGCSTKSCRRRRKPGVECVNENKHKLSIIPFK